MGSLVYFLLSALIVGTLGEDPILSAVSPKKCEDRTVTDYQALWDAGCWRCSKNDKICMFTSPCADKKKNRKFNCKNSPGGFCKECNKCTCDKNGNENCPVNVISCQDQLKYNLKQGCFLVFKKKCRFVYPCPIECKKGDKKCDECNFCKCKKGKWACTKKGCPPCSGDCWKLQGKKKCVCDSCCKGTNPLTPSPCNPGEKACNKCNGCQCNANNQWICTLIGCLQPCPKDCWGFDKSGKCECKAHCDGNNQFPQSLCLPGQQKKACYACNTCHCSNGQWGCTKIGCFEKCPSDCWVFDDKLGRCVCKDLCEPKKPECEKGDEKCDECNYCFCLNGKWTCTKKGCQSCVGDCWKLQPNKQCVCESCCKGTNPLTSPCNPGEKACNKCNGCQCNANNQWICTLIGCLQPCPKDCWGFDKNGKCECKAHCDGSNQFPQSLCLPGQQKKACYACNTCHCSNGQWGCTKIGCLEKCPSDCWVFDDKLGRCVCKDLCEPKKPECEKGDEKCDECNYCFCLNGKWTCTKKGCQTCVGDCWKLQPNNQCVCESACAGANPLFRPCNRGDVACDKCNRCSCFGSNNDWVCTRQSCPEPCPPDCWGFNDKTGDCECKTRCDGSSQLPLGSCRADEMACQACNKCTCHDGGWSCTEKACLQKCASDCWVINENGQCVCKDVCNVEEPECKPGEGKCDECNYCFCSNGKWACTERDCAPCVGDCWKLQPNKQCVCESACVGATPTYSPCNIGDTACSKCNKCHCGNNNLWACTKIGCLQPCPPDCWGLDKVSGRCECKTHCDGSSQLPFGLCKMGQMACQACNKCTCDAGGWACTEKACLQKCASDCWVIDENGQCVCKDVCDAEEPECKPGEEKCDECNHCFCSNGKWVCTKIACGPCVGDCWGVDKVTGRCVCKTHCDGSSQYPIGLCKGGQMACQACNKCTCDAGDWSCTEKDCLQKCASDCWAIDKNGECVCKDLCDD